MLENVRWIHWEPHGGSLTASSTSVTKNSVKLVHRKRAECGLRSMWSIPDKFRWVLFRPKLFTLQTNARWISIWDSQRWWSKTMCIIAMKEDAMKQGRNWPKFRMQSGWPNLHEFETCKLFNYTVQKGLLFNFLFKHTLSTFFSNFLWSLHNFLPKENACLFTEEASLMYVLNNEILSGETCFFERPVETRFVWWLGPIFSEKLRC